MSDEYKSQMPAPPDGLSDPEIINGAEERWETCPLNDCKRKPDLLYSDFFLRDLRTNRLMCNACAVRVEMGYMAREVKKASEDRFFTGNIATDMVLFGVMLGGSIIGNMAALYIGVYYAFFLGGGIGAAIAVWARRLAGKKVTRQSHFFGTAGIIAGAIVAMLISPYFTMGNALVDMIACSIGMTLASWGIFLRRI